jgi:RND superfamily putative drug exporter
VRLIEEPYGKGAATANAIVITAAQGERITDEQDIQYMEKLQNKLLAVEGIQSVSSIHSLFKGLESAQTSAILNEEPRQLPPEVNFLVDRYISRSMDTAVIEVYFSEYAASDLNRNLMKNIEAEIIPNSNPPEGLSFYIGGETSAGLDTNEVIQDSLIPVLLIMLALIYLILLITFRSVFLPLKAIVMNLFSVGATYGILVFVFAQGHGIEWFGAESRCLVSEWRLRF